MTIHSMPILKYFEWQKPVIAIQSSPPESSVKGDAYLVNISSTGLWIEQAGNIAVYVGDLSPSGWAFIEKKDGMIVYVKSMQKFVAYIGSSWTMTNIV
jgi:hypothetical protein